jgi:hypothetical protein
MDLATIRKNGIGSNFAVISPEDGYRKDGTVWFGECANCGERVVSALSTKFSGWTHEVRTDIRYHDSGEILTYKSSAIDYCPKG